MNHQKAYKQNENLDHHATILRQPKIFAYCMIQHISLSKWDEWYKDESYTNKKHWFL